MKFIIYTYRTLIHTLIMIFSYEFNRVIMSFTQKKVYKTFSLNWILCTVFNKQKTKHFSLKNVGFFAALVLIPSS